MARSVPDSTLEGGLPGQLAGMSSAKRRTHFKSAAKLKDLRYDTSKTYTCGFWQDLFDPADFSAHLPFGTFEVAKYLDGQPMQVMAQVGAAGGAGGPNDLWRVELWHEKVAEQLAVAQAEGRARAPGAGNN